MTKIQYLNHQADKADRLARDISDPLTVERLTSLSREYRQNAKALGDSVQPGTATEAPGEAEQPDGN